MGRDFYWLTTPSFTRLGIALGQSGRSLVIEVPEAGEGMPYIKSAFLNGQTLDRAWIRHEEIAGGAILRFDLSAERTDWGTSQLPPS